MSQENNNSENIGGEGGNPSRATSISTQDSSSAENNQTTDPKLNESNSVVSSKDSSRENTPPQIEKDEEDTKLAPLLKPASVFDNEVNVQRKQSIDGIAFPKPIQIESQVCENQSMDTDNDSCEQK